MYYLGLYDTSELQQTLGNSVVLFPIDVRYGWDLNHGEHQRLLTELDSIFSPSSTILQPTMMLTDDRMKRQNAPFLSFLRKHIDRVVREGRHTTILAPKTAHIWQNSSFTDFCSSLHCFDTDFPLFSLSSQRPDTCNMK